MQATILATILIIGQANDIPETVLKRIQHHANHSATSADTRDYLVRRGCEAYLELQDFKPNDVSRSALFRIKEVAANKHPNDYSTQLYCVKNQSAAWIQVYRFTDSRITLSDLMRKKEKANDDHPDDYSTQLYVLNQQSKPHKKYKIAPGPIQGVNLR